MQHAQRTRVDAADSAVFRGTPTNSATAGPCGTTVADPFTSGPPAAPISGRRPYRDGELP